MRAGGRAAIVLAGALLVAPDAALACTCVYFPLCESLWRESREPSSFVDATVDAVDETTAGVAVVRLGDVRTLRGPAVDIVETSTLVDNCGYRFTVGTRYLIEAVRRGDGRGETSTCSRTAPLAEARADVAYLESLSRPAPGGRVFGRAVAAFSVTTKFDDDERRPLPGVQMQLSGPVSRSATTLADGTFAFEGLPAGEYRLSAQTDARLAPAVWPGETFALPNGYACHESTVYLERPRRE